MNVTIIPPKKPVTVSSLVGLLVTWLVPIMPNGIILEYLIEYFPSSNSSLSRSVTANCCSYSINDLGRIKFDD